MDDPSIDQQLYQKRMRMLCQQLCKGNLSYAFWIVALLAILWFAESDRTGMAVWAVAAAVAEYLKTQILKACLNSAEIQDLSVWEWRIVITMFVQGIIVSGGMMLLLDINKQTALFVSIMLLVASAYYAALFMVASRRIYFVWATALIVPVALKLFTSSDEYYWVFGAIMVVASISYIPYMSKFLFEQLIASLKLQFENLDLLAVAEKAQQKSEQASADKTRFLASASHDLRQPMQAMALNIETLMHRLEQTENCELIEALRDSHSLMSRMMNSLLDISKLDAGVVEVNLESIQLDLVIECLSHDYARIAENKGVTFESELMSACVYSDLLHIERILSNLIANAVRYTNKGGRILVSCRKQQHRVVVEIRDTGIGMPQDQLSNIFLEFYQINNPARDRQKGLGLGLSIVDRLVYLLPDHAIEVFSEPGQGSCFRITMPAAEDSAPVNAEIIAVENEPFEGMRILILEDDRVVRKAAVLLLQQWGCDIADVGSSDEALAVVRKGWVPDAIIADYRLPGDMTGLQTVESIRKLLKQSVPALILTGETDAETLRHIEQSGIPLLHKPVAPAKLMLFLRQCRTIR